MTNEVSDSLIKQKINDESNNCDLSLMKKSHFDLLIGLTNLIYC